MHKLQILVRRYAVGLLAVLVAVSLTLGTLALISVQNTRADAIKRACEQQNTRHTGTIQELETLLARAEKTASPVQRKQIATSRSFTILLIDQLAPYQDCSKVVTRATH